MEYEKIKQLMDDMSSSKLTELDIEFPEGIKISMKKECENTSSNDFSEKVVQIEAETEANHVEVKGTNKKAGNVVTSPMVGTFYLKPSPSATPYVEIGKEIKKGETLCIIEAMKLMNEIESEYSGVIKEILVEDGKPVEFGTELFVIE